MKFIENNIPIYSAAVTIGYVYRNILKQEAEAKTTPVHGVVVGAVLFGTILSIADVAINTLAIEYKDFLKKLSFLVASICTIEIMGLGGLLTPGFGGALAVVIVASSYLYVKIRPSVSKIEKNEKNFSIIAGMQPVKDQLNEQIILPFRNPKLCEMYGNNPSTSVLFYGQPGCGKTLFAEALAGELDLPLIKVSSADFGSIYLHGAVSMIQQVFNNAIANSPCILFMDEFDGVASERTNFNDSSARSLNSEITELLTQIDRALLKGVIIIAATNHIGLLDPSVVRDGRFDTKIEITRPDLASRKEIFEHYLSKCPFKENMDYEKLAQISFNCTSSRIKTMVQTVVNSAMTKALKMPKVNDKIPTVLITMDLFKECYPMYFQNV